MLESGTVPGRADARRNRALVLQAARSAFEEGGLGVPLGEIARRAGVGAGTVYRHFRSKDALFRATVEDRLRLFIDTARDLAHVPDPGDVFFRFVSSVVRLAARNKALCTALERADRQEAKEAQETKKSKETKETEETKKAIGSPRALEEEFWAALGVLLERAQDDGAVRKDVHIADVRVLVVGCMTMELRRVESGPGDGVQGRMVALMCDGLRSGRDVTKLPFDSARSNETACEECGGAVQAAATGRPPRYCGGACRQKAHRARARTRPDPAGPEVTTGA